MAWDDCKKSWPKEYDQSKIMIEEIVNHLRSKYTYQIKKEEKRKQTQFHHFINKSELYSDVIAICVTAKFGRGIDSKANVGKIVKKVFPLVDSKAMSHDVSVYKHLKLKT